MTAIFSFEGLLIVFVLLVCTCAYLHGLYPALLDRSKTGVTGVLWKMARIGERLSPWVAAACLLLGVVHLFG